MIKQEQNSSKTSSEVVGSSESAAVDQQADQSQTEAEKYFAPFLLNALAQAKLKGYLSVQELLAVPLKSNNAEEAVSKQLEQMRRRFASSRYSLRRADFALIKYGVVIEIDGSAHDSNQGCLDRDVTRDAEYASLGFVVLVIPNDEVYDSGARGKALIRVVDLARLEQNRPDFRQRWQKRRQAISRARKGLSASDPSLDLGQYQRRQSLQYCVGQLKGTPQWSGHRIRLS